MLEMHDLLVYSELHKWNTCVAISEALTHSAPASVLENYATGPSMQATPEPNTLWAKVRRPKPSYMSYWLAYDEDRKIIAGAGTEMDKGTLHILKRAFVIPSDRAKRYPLHQIAEGQLQALNTYPGLDLLKSVVFEVNEANKALYDGIVRMQEGRAVSFGENGRWPSFFRLFKPVGKRLYHGVDQYTLEASVQDIARYLRERHAR